MTLNEAERLASAGRCVEDRLERATRQGVAPKAEPFFRRKIDFGDEVVTLELGIAAEPVGGYLEWAGKRVVVGLDRRNVLLIALACIGEAAADVRRASDLRAPATMSMYNDVPSFDPARTSPTSSTRAEEGNGAARQRNKARTRNWRSHRAPSQMMRDFSGPRTTRDRFAHIPDSPDDVTQPRSLSARFCKKSHPMGTDQAHEYFPTLDDPALI